MSESEYLDIFDDNMKHIGTAPRAEVHAKGHWHHTFHCWLLRRDGDRKFVLFQRRGPDKSLYPNTLDITAAGHLTAGETPADGIRELEEELGVKVDFGNIIPLGIRCDVAIIGTMINREFCHTFMYESGLPLDSYKLQLEEVSGLVEMEIKDGLNLFSQQNQLVPVSGYQVDAAGKKRPVEINVSEADIIPRLDHYYLKVFIMAERYFQGKRSLAI